jgi:hypothetical protein
VRRLYSINQRDRLKHTQPSLTLHLEFVLALYASITNPIDLPIDDEHFTCSDQSKANQPNQTKPNRRLAMQIICQDMAFADTSNMYREMGINNVIFSTRYGSYDLWLMLVGMRF